MSVTIVIPGHCYSLKNHRPIFRAGGGKGRPFLGKDSKLKAYQKRAAEIIRASMPNPQGPPCDCPVNITLRFYYAGPRPDALGPAETIFDCLEDAGVVSNDAHLVPCGAPAIDRIHVRKVDERVEIVLSDGRPTA